MARAVIDQDVMSKKLTIFLNLPHNSWREGVANFRALHILAIDWKDSHFEYPIRRSPNLPEKDIGSS